MVVALCHISIVSVNLTSKQTVIESFSFPNGGKPPPIVCQSCSNKARNSRHPPPSEQLQREHLCNGVPIFLLSRMSDVPSLGLRGIYSGGVGRMCNKLFCWGWGLLVCLFVSLLHPSIDVSDSKTKNKVQNNNWIVLQAHRLPRSPHPEMQKMHPSAARRTLGTAALRLRSAAERLRFRSRHPSQLGLIRRLVLFRFL